MAIYFAGAEEISFATFGTVIMTATAGHFRSSWARAAINVNTAAGDVNANPPGNRIETPQVFTSTSDLWFHAHHRHNSANTTNNSRLLGFASPDGVWRLYLSGTGTGGQLKLEKRNAAGTVTTLATTAASVVPDSVLFQLDVHIVYSTTGSVDVYKDNVSILSYSGDVTTDSATQLNKFFLSSATTNDGSWSEIIAADQDTRAMAIFTETLTGAGNTEIWTGAYTDVDETTINDADMLNTANNDELAQFTHPTSLPAGNWDVLAVGSSVRLRRGGSGPQNFQFNVRPAVAGTDHESADIAATASYAHYNYVWDLNPSGPAAWDVADVGSGFNTGIKSRA